MIKVQVLGFYSSVLECLSVKVYVFVCIGEGLAAPTPHFWVSFSSCWPLSSLLSLARGAWPLRLIIPNCLFSEET